MVSSAFVERARPATLEVADQKAAPSRRSVSRSRSGPRSASLGVSRSQRARTSSFLRDDLDAVADGTATAVSLRNGSLDEILLDHERLARDLKVAEQVQHQLLPQSLPKLPGYAFFAYYHAAHEVGGDYYDFVPLPDNRLGIALGDVSGKGVAAALIMAKFSGDTRLNLLAEGSTAAAARVLNTALCETGIDERFITLSLLVLEANTGRLQLCSAGHPPVLLRRADGTVEELGKDVGGFPLGIVPDADVPAGQGRATGRAMLPSSTPTA